jgi:hypothetical protein
MEIDSAIEIFNDPFKPDGPSSPSEGNNTSEINLIAKKSNSKANKLITKDMKIKLSNRQLDSYITKLHKKSYPDYNLNLMKVQAFILTYINEDRRNIVHLACYFGNLNLLSFLMERVRFLEIES